MTHKKQPFGEPIIYDRNGKPIYAKTHGQHELVKAIDQYDILFVNGPAGTGKTFISVCKAVKAIDENRYEKLVLTRPAVESGEELGALPGDINDKISPYMKPLYQCIEKIKCKKPKSNGNGNGNGNGKKKKITKAEPQDDSKYIEGLFDKIDVSPLAYMRGLTFTNSFIIMDEAQNVSDKQMKLFLTRLGQHSKVIINGDESQSDLDRNIRSGFRHAQKLLNDVKGIGFVTLNENDIVRHKLVKDIILKYEHEKRTDQLYSNRDPE